MLDTRYTGYIAASFTSLFWSVNSLIFSAAGKRIGSFTVNQLRLAMAVAMLSAVRFAYFGTFLPSCATDKQIFYLAVSGFIGLVIGDSAYFASLVIIGPKSAAVLMILSTPFAAIIAWPVLGERLHIFVAIGMTLTILGTALAVSGRRQNKTPCKSLTSSCTSLPKRGLGVFLGLLGALGQAVGIVMAKKGVGNLDALSGTLIRMMAAAGVIWVIAVCQVTYALCRHKQSSIGRSIHDSRALKLILCGAVLGQFLGVWLSLVAVKLADIAVTSTIMSTFPLLVIPQTMIIHKERPQPREYIGAIIGVLGVVLLFAPSLCRILFR